MATVAQVERFRRSQDQLESLIRRDVRTMQVRMSSGSAPDVRDELLRVTPVLSYEYGLASAAMAAEWFEDVTRRTARVGATAPQEAVRGSVRYMAGDLFKGERQQAFDKLAQSMTRHSLQGGRNTIVSSSQRNRISFARAPNPGACAFCLMLASRGAVYSSRQAAGAGNDFHDDCRCVVEPVIEGGAISYDANALYEQYRSAHTTRDKAADVASKMRELYGLK